VIEWLITGDKVLRTEANRSDDVIRIAASDTPHILLIFRILVLGILRVGAWAAAIIGDRLLESLTVPLMLLQLVRIVILLIPIVEPAVLLRRCWELTSRRFKSDNIV